MKKLKNMELKTIKAGGHDGTIHFPGGGWE